MVVNPNGTMQLAIAHGEELRQLADAAKGMAVGAMMAARGVAMVASQAAGMALVKITAATFAAKATIVVGVSVIKIINSAPIRIIYRISLPQCCHLSVGVPIVQGLGAVERLRGLSSGSTRGTAPPAFALAPPGLGEGDARAKAGGAKANHFGQSRRSGRTPPFKIAISGASPVRCRWIASASGGLRTH